MHTYLKQDKDNYEVGQWLINREGHHQFNMLFSVPSLRQAMVAVNMLNGGSRISGEALHLKEKE
jgi:hypothetical protein